VPNTDDVVVQPRRVETEMVARCARCKAPLYVESILEERQGEELVETGRVVQGTTEALAAGCPCAEEAAP
jgi:hypothetical protein